MENGPVLKPIHHAERKKNSNKLKGMGDRCKEVEK